ncbi:hypothetical protein BJF90_21630 [Pseudonocardia sp. CNS-004]|nr:hypothetical protein BJF90_21630 [Pseudonocardia sp. CNS-004]
MCTGNVSATYGPGIRPARGAGSGVSDSTDTSYVRTGGSPGPRKDWPVARSYSHPCHGQASNASSSASTNSPGPPEVTHGFVRPRQSGPPMWGQWLLMA